MRFSGWIVLLSCVMLGSGCQPEAPAPKNEVAVRGAAWLGELSLGDLRWQVVLREPAGAEPAEMDVISLWRARVPLPDFQRSGETISFSLPEDLGAFSGRRDGDRISGGVKAPDGTLGALQLTLTNEPSIGYEDFEVQSEGVKIAATLAKPAGSGPFPLVAILHGGGDSDRQAAPYRFWADFLPRHGIAVAIYDKRGNGASGGDWRAVGFEARARDVESVLRAARSHDRVDPSRIGLIAVSQGGWVSTLVDSETPDLRFVVQISAPVVPVWQADTYANRVSYRADGLSEPEIDRALEIWLTSLDVTRDPESSSARRALERAVDSARGDDWFEQDPYDPDPVGTPFRQWYRLVLDFDPRPILSQSNTPMLWIYGDMDTQSDVFANVEELGILRSTLGKPFSVSVYPRAGHGVMIPLTFVNEPTWPMMTAAPGFFDDLLLWMRSAFE